MLGKIASLMAAVAMCSGFVIHPEEEMDILELNFPYYQGGRDCGLIDLSTCQKCERIEEHFPTLPDGCIIFCDCVADLEKLFEGDIKVSGESAGMINYMYARPPKQVDPSISNGLISISSWLWPRNEANNVVYVPYVINSAITDSTRINAISNAIADYNTNTCIRLVQRTNEEDYIHFTQGSGCSSYIGRQRGSQDVSISNGCGVKGIVIHEVMHALGFWHEQSRPDRDSYVVINRNNITPGFERNFNIGTNIDSRGSPYDYGSIMHYGRLAFSANGRNTIDTKPDPNVVIGQRAGFSVEDINQINLAYKCNSATTAPVATTLASTIKPETESTTQIVTTGISTSESTSEAATHSTAPSSTSESTTLVNTSPVISIHSTVPTSASTTMITTTTSVGECHNEGDDAICELNKEICYYPPYQRYCMKTCNACCEDSYGPDFCSYFSHLCSGDYQAFMTQSCRRTCGYC